MSEEDIREYHNIGRAIKHSDKMMNGKIVSLQEYREAMNLE